MCAVATSKQEALAERNHGNEPEKRTVQLDRTKGGALCIMSTTQMLLQCFISFTPRQNGEGQKGGKIAFGRLYCS